MVAKIRPLVPALLAAGLLVPSGCAGGAGAPPPPPRADRFDAERAFADLRMQVRLGPRPAGSAPSRVLAERLRRALPRGRFEAVPGGLRNVVGSLPGRGGPILVGAHYDTKDIPGFVGANDGGSSTALLMELARVLKDKPREFTYELVFFDGEEAWGDWNTGNTFGSRHYVDAAKKAGTLAGVKAMILLDMIGERGVEIRKDLNSTSWLNDIIWRAAARLGHQRTFIADTTAVEDDHLPFLKAGVPAVDLIDLDYPAWHTAGDTLDKIDPQSLEIVGGVVVAALPDIEKRLAR